MFATWTFISIGRRVTQVSKFAFRLRSESILLFKGWKKTLENCDFQSSQANIHPSIFSSSRSFSARVLLTTQRPQSPTRPHYEAMSNCKPKSTFFSYTCWFFLWSMDIGLHFLTCFHVPSLCRVPATMVPWDLPRKRPRK